MLKAARTRAMLVLTLLFLVLAARPAQPAALAALAGARVPQAVVPTAPLADNVSTALAEASQLQQQADRDIDARQYKEAGEKADRALRLRRQYLGDMHRDVAYSLARLGTIAYRLGQYERAETLFADALRIREATLGADDLAVAESLGDLASMYLLRGDYVRPDPLYQRVLAIYEQAAAGPTVSPGRNVQDLIAGVLNNLALLSDRRGDYQRAESLYLRALGIREAMGGPDDPSVAETLANLGAVYYVSDQDDRAVQVLQRALAIQEKRLPTGHPSLATSNFNLAAVYFNQGDYPNAEIRFRRALEIDERAVDAMHPRLAIRLVGLAEVLRLRGEYAQAEPLYERALRIRDRALGASHPQVADTLIARSLLRYATGDFDGAADLLTQGAERREETLKLVLASGSEEGKRLYLRTLVDETDIAVSLHLGAAPTSSAAAHLALTNILQRKGRSIDAMADQMATLRSRLNDADRNLLTRLSETQSQLATLVLRGTGTDDQRQSATALRGEIQRLEQAISTTSGEFRVASRTATLSEIQGRLPIGTALIEFAAYRPFSVRNPRETAFGPPRYAVYVLRHDGIAASVDLAETAVVDLQGERFRAALSSPGAPDAEELRQAANTLYRALMAPIQSALTDVEQIIISPDGALNLLPFAALVGEDHRYAIEHFTISYLTSGRDLTRLRDSTPNLARAAAAPMIVADPSFDGQSVEAAAATQPAASRSLPATVLEPGLRFSPLPGTAQEATALAEILPEARVYTGPAATEALLKRSTGPSILHVATHGFFLRPSAAARVGSDRRGWSIVSPRVGAAVEREEALILSGLALAGANQRWSGEGEDGLLTALEVAGLDLWGTRMVVLSACETGIGDARNGEGVYGLRRALVLAGSESQVMSLWQVSDSATRDLMVAFYQRLRSGEGRAEALRKVQLALLDGNGERAHPFYWASFIQSGDWRAVFD